MLPTKSETPNSPSRGIKPPTRGTPKQAFQSSKRQKPKDHEL